MFIVQVNAVQFLHSNNCKSSVICLCLRGNLSTVKSIEPAAVLTISVPFVRLKTFLR